MKIKPISHITPPKYPILAAAVTVAAIGGGMVALRSQTIWTADQLDKTQEMFRTAGVPPYDEPQPFQHAEEVSSPSSPELQIIPDRPVDTPGV